MCKRLDLFDSNRVSHVVFVDVFKPILNLKCRKKFNQQSLGETRHKKLKIIICLDASLQLSTPASETQEADVGEESHENQDDPNTAQFTALCQLY